MYRLTVKNHVMIAHSLPDPYFGPAAALHGATLVVEVTWRRRELNEHAVVMDIGEANTMLEETLSTIRYQNLDEHEAFKGKLSTTEAIATYISEDLRTRFDESEYAGMEVLLHENPDAWASYDVDFT